jgi:hypothetical protein
MGESSDGGGASRKGKTPTNTKPRIPIVRFGSVVVAGERQPSGAAKGLRNLAALVASRSNLRHRSATVHDDRFAFNFALHGKSGKGSRMQSSRERMIASQ